MDMTDNRRVESDTSEVGNTCLSVSDDIYCLCMLCVALSESSNIQDSGYSGGGAHAADRKTSF